MARLPPGGGAGVPHHVTQRGNRHQPVFWPWSNAAAHLAGHDDEAAIVAPLLQRIPDFAGLLASTGDREAVKRLERAASAGRPLGEPGWLAALEARLRRTLAPRRRGPKPRQPENPAADTLPGIK